MKRRHLLGGPRDGERVGFEGGLPTMLVIDGTAYELDASGRVYRAASRRKWTRVSDRDLRAFLAHVAGGESISRACELSGVSSGAVYRRRIDPDFRRALERARDRSGLSPWRRPKTLADLAAADPGFTSSPITSIACVGGPLDGRKYPGPPNTITAGGEVYLLATDLDGSLRYIAEGIKEGLVDLAVRAFEREEDE